MLFWRSKQREQNPREKRTLATPIDRLVQGLVVSIGVAACLWYAVGLFAHWQVQRELRDIRLRGEPVVAADLRGQDIAADQNAAPLLMAALHGLDPQLTGGDKALLANYAKAGRANPNQRRAVDALLAAQSWRIPLVEAALRRSQCRFPVKWEEGAAARFPHLAQLRAGSLLLCAQAVQHAERGRPKSAAEDLRIHLRLAGTLAREPQLVSQLFRWGIIRKSEVGLQALLRISDPPPSSLETLRATLRSVDVITSLRDALLGERVMGIIYCDEFFDDFAREQEEQDGQRIPFLPTGRSIIPGTWLSLNKLNYLRHMKWAISRSLVPYRSLDLDEVRRLDDTPSGTWLTGLMTAILAPLCSRAVAARDAAIADLNQAIIAIDLELYRRQHAGFPQSLDALREIDPAVQLEDPFSGKPMRYQKTPGGYRMWSIGRNLRDDGGKPGRNREEGDIVWEVNLDSGSSPE